MEGDTERIQDNSPETKMGLDKVRRTLLIKTLVLSSYQAELHKLMHCGKQRQGLYWDAGLEIPSYSQVLLWFFDLTMNLFFKVFF